MPLQIVRNDITQMHCDAIVNAANCRLQGGGGVDGAIHAAAGPELLEECRTLGGCAVGQAKITRGYRLPCAYVIHTVGPRWSGGNGTALLASCYRESLRLAKKYHCQSVAFPLISSGAYGWPKDRAFSVAMEEISKFLLENDMLIYLVVYDKDGFLLSKRLFRDIIEYIDENYVQAHPSARRRQSEFIECTVDASSFSCAAAPQGGGLRDLTQMLGELDESFAQMLLRKIDERGMTDAQCYKKANLDRKLFSKIRKDPAYRPSKLTAIAFAIALELPMAEANELLRKAGFALSHSNQFDVIIEYFIQHGNYNIFEINEALFFFDQPLLGGV